MCTIRKLYPTQLHEWQLGRGSFYISDKHTSPWLHHLPLLGLCYHDNCRLRRCASLQCHSELNTFPGCMYTCTYVPRNGGISPGYMCTLRNGVISPGCMYTCSAYWWHMLIFSKHLIGILSINCIVYVRTFVCLYTACTLSTASFCCHCSCICIAHWHTCIHLQEMALALVVQMTGVLLYGYCLGAVAATFTNVSSPKYGEMLSIRSLYAVPFKTKKIYGYVYGAWQILN